MSPEVCQLNTYSTRWRIRHIMNVEPSRHALICFVSLVLHKHEVLTRTEDTFPFLHGLWMCLCSPQVLLQCKHPPVQCLSGKGAMKQELRRVEQGSNASSIKGWSSAYAAYTKNILTINQVLAETWHSVRPPG